ncbi:MAG: glycosyltransferase family 1 protein [Desulfotomaculaceae bacterium]|nr:glycosyltransferase family 1 protein [Desulfotomaculaceae bacterium]
MKLAVNLTFMMDGKQLEGIGQFALNLLQGLQAIGKLDKNFHLFVFDSFYEKVVSLFPEAKVIPIAVRGDFNNSNKYHRFFKSMYIDLCLVPHLLKKDRYDLLFHPFNATNDYISNKVPTLITLHDLFFKNFPNELSKKYINYLKYRYKGIIYKTSHIVVPSQFVKQDILKYYPGADPGKITVINNPIWVDFEKTRAFPVKKPYILCVNSIRSHKNLITLLRAFQLIQDQVEHHLVLTGAIGDPHIDLGQYAAQQQIEKLLLTGYLPDEQRNYLYQNADLFVSPSLHEGFGMTPVEAALFETPVLTTRETSIPEVTRNMVNYYEPAADPHALAAQILHLLEHQPPKSELQRVGQTLVQEYEPEKIATLYFDIFERLIRG